MRHIRSENTWPGKDRKGAEEVGQLSWVKPDGDILKRPERSSARKWGCFLAAHRGESLSFVSTLKLLLLKLFVGCPPASFTPLVWDRMHLSPLLSPFTWAHPFETRDDKAE